MIYQVGRNFFFIQRGWLNANHFVFNGRNKILIDTGYLPHFEETRRWVEAVGLPLASVELIISTHSHCDHIGGNQRIREISGCRIAIHPIDKQSVESEDDWATWYRFYDQEAEFFPVDRPLEDGESIFLDDLELNVIYTPGHARGGIALYAPKERFLISSDALWDGDTGVLNTIVEGQEAPSLAMESLEKLASLDVHTVYPGHGGVVRDPQKAFQKCRKKLEGFMKNPSKMGNDHLKKILVWSLLNKKGFPKNDFFAYLMTTHWFKAVTDSYFEGKYQEKFNEIMEEFLKRGIVHVENGYYYTTVHP